MSIVYTNDFSYIKDNHCRNMVLNAYNAVKELRLEDFFATIEPPANTGYMFWDDHRLNSFIKLLEKDGHSGSSFSWTCRVIQDYFRNGGR